MKLIKWAILGCSLIFIGPGVPAPVPSGPTFELPIPPCGPHVCPPQPPPQPCVEECVIN